jgi:tight adherence protein B
MSITGATYGLLVVTLLLLPGPAAAQSDEVQIDDIRADEYPTVEISVTVPAELADQKLSKDPFTVTEDGRTVQPYLGLTEDSDEQPAPRVVLAIDVSRSMRSTIDQAKAAADQFVSRLPEGSQVAVIAFGATTQVLIDSTADLATVRSRIAATEIDPQTGTALNEAVAQAAELATSPSASTANIVLLSDGADDDQGQPQGDIVSQEEAIDALRSTDARLWAVSLPSGQQNDDALNALAGDDGRVLPVADASELETLYQGLASDLSREYVLRYESEASGETEVAVTLDYGTLLTQDVTTVTIDGEPSAGTSGGQAVTAITSGAEGGVSPFGTFGAFVIAVLALAVASTTFWLAVLLPRVTRPGDRLSAYSYSETTGDRLTALARWTTDFTDRQLQRRDLGTRLDAQLESAGLDIRPGEFVVIVASIMVVMTTIGLFIGGGLLGIMLALLVPVSVRVWLSMRRDKRQAAFADQLTDVLQLIAGSLRAGYSLNQGIDAVSRDAAEPAATEFRRILIEHRLGRDLNEAMANCAERMDNEDFSWVVQAIGIHREVGGDLARVLDNIVSTIRDRATVHRQVRTLSAEGRMSARLLTALPILVIVSLQFTSPDYLSPMLSEPLGLFLLGLAATLILVGLLVIRRMTKIQY